jgi:L-fuculose-phosphate aldolase
MKTVDLSELKVVATADIDEARKQGATELILRGNAIVTPSARDAIASAGLAVRKPAALKATPSDPVAAYAEATKAPVSPAAAALQELFSSAEAQAVKEEICAVGRKLWYRGYVDGNGGNISYRIGPNEVICTPTLCSKADLKPEDLCLVDLEGNQLVGSRPRTSEILLHLEIYKAVPQAKGVVHCHPPHSTAYAITGRVPPNCVIPEYEVFVGNVALSPYETPGTKKFAETVLPYVKQYNTVLLANHGIVCWADTVTHAEWYAEVLETYCMTLMLASQLGTPLTRIPAEKASDLLEIKKRLGLPDVRFAQECQLCDLPDDPNGAIAIEPQQVCNTRPAAGNGTVDVEAIVQAVTDAVLAALKKQ